MCSSSWHRWLLGLAGLALSGFLSGQTLEGSASVWSTDCYQVTPNANSMSGAVWFPGPVDITSSFEMRAQVYLGTNDGGADGMAFLIRNPNSLPLGSTPGGANQGFGGITPSLIVEMDTYTNSLNPAWDPVGNPADHVAILSNGSPSHNAASALAGPVAAVPPNANIEDGAYHDLRVTWDAATGEMEVYFDCLLRLEATVDMPALIGSDEAYYGFTASTGGLSNAHRVCDVQWNPFDPEVLPASVALCPGAEVTWTLPGGATDILWAPAEGLSSVTASEVTLTATTAATYSVTWTDPCGITYSDEVEVSLVESEDVTEQVEACLGTVVALDPAGPAAVVVWEDGTVAPNLEVVESGTYVGAVDLAGCTFTWTAEVNFTPEYDVDLGPDQTLCLGTTADLDASDASWPGPPPTYTWNGQPGGPTFTDAGPGWVEVEVDAGGCVFTDAVNLEASLNTGVDLGTDLELCWYDEVTWDTGYPGNATSWWGQTSSGWELLSIGSGWDWDGAAAAGYDALAASVMYAGCSESDTVAVVAVPAYDPDLPATVHFCEGTSVVLEAAPGADAYLWAGGPAVPSFEVDAAGNAVLTASVAGCTVEAVVEVIADPVPPVDCGPDIFVCEGTEVVLDAGVFVADAFAWSGPAGPSFDPQVEAPVSGNYAVTVTAGDCSASDEVEVTIQPLPVFELGEDRLGCPGVPEAMEAVGLPPEADLTWGHGPTGAGVEVAESGTYTAVANWNGCFHVDAVQVTFAAPLVLDLPSVVKKCLEDTVYFDVGLPPDVFPIAYAWSTGATTPAVACFDHGSYSVAVSNACESLQAAVDVVLESCACQLHVPTAFTPDNDGVNDAFRPVFNCPVDRYVLRIYDRWGKVVFATSDPEAHWFGQIPDGTADDTPYFAANGLYAWQVELNYFQQGAARAEVHQGHVWMIR